MRRQKRSEAPDGLAAALAQLRASEAENERLRAQVRRLSGAAAEIAHLEAEVARVSALRAMEQQTNEKLRKRLHVDDRKRLRRQAALRDTRPESVIDDATQRRIGTAAAKRSSWKLPPPAG